MLDGMVSAAEFSAYKTGLEEALLWSTQPILLCSLAASIWIKKDIDPDKYWAQRIGSKDWFPVTARWLFSREYTEVVSPQSVTLESALNEDGTYSLEGEPLSQSCKAKEATPKYIPPLFEEREI